MYNDKTPQFHYDSRYLLKCFLFVRKCIYFNWISETCNVLAVKPLNNYIIPVIQQIPIQSDTQKHPGSMPCSRACWPIYHQAKKHEPEPSKIPPQFPNSCPSTIWDPSHSTPQEEKLKIQLIPFPTSKNPTMHQQPREWTKEKKGKDRKQHTMQFFYTFCKNTFKTKGIKDN